MAKRPNNSVRVIGGRWRGRRLRFPAATGLRPTADRLRETLFNWISADLEGARCLDLFAGSGALALEAASRGAAHVTAVEASRAAVHALRHNVDELDAADVIEVVQARAGNYLARSPRPVDLAFIDPPFARPELATDTLARLARGGWLRPGACVYLEAPARGGSPAALEQWMVLRRKAAGDAHGLLLRWRGDAAAPGGP